MRRQRRWKVREKKKYKAIFSLSCMLTCVLTLWHEGDALSLHHVFLTIVRMNGGNTFSSFALPPGLSPPHFLPWLLIHF